MDLQLGEKVFLSHTEGKRIKEGSFRKKEETKRRVGGAVEMLQLDHK